MIAFASNSLLCRAALRDTGIDAASFTFIRILSGALVLWLIIVMRRIRFPSPQSSPKPTPSPSSFILLPEGEDGRGSPFSLREKGRDAGNWASAFALFIYAAAFSFAYNTLPAGTGALLLFGAVQATMILWGFGKGERLDVIQIAGLIMAVAGLVVLVLPGLSAPPLIGSVLMLSAGIAWGIYSLRGKIKGPSGSDSDPIAATAGNFLRAVPFAALVSIIMLATMHLDASGIIYAVISGALTSGIGYVIWYAALPGLNAASAATVQLSVPVLAATGGIFLLGESITLRYVIASIAVLGGIFLVVIEKQRGPSGPLSK